MYRIDAPVSVVRAVLLELAVDAPVVGMGAGTQVRGWSPDLLERVERRVKELTNARIVVATAIIREREVLAQQRAFPPETAGRWELPGGRVEPGESEVDAVRRECFEELGVTVEPGDGFGPDVVLAGGEYLLRSFTARLVDGEPKPKEHQAVRWVTAEGLDELDWLPADRALLPDLRSLL